MVFLQMSAKSIVLDRKRSFYVGGKRSNLPFVKFTCIPV